MLTFGQLALYPPFEKGGITAKNSKNIDRVKQVILDKKINAG